MKVEFGEVVRNQEENFFTAVRAVVLRRGDFLFDVAPGFVHSFGKHANILVRPLDLGRTQPGGELLYGGPRRRAPPWRFLVRRRAGLRPQLRQACEHTRATPRYCQTAFRLSGPQSAFPTDRPCRWPC